MDGIFRRRRLPHWDVEGAPYFVTFCLDGSIPAAGLSELNQYRQALQRRPRPPAVTKVDWHRQLHKLLFARLDKLLDFQPAVRHFDDPALATVVRDAMEHFSGERYQSLAWVVMPSHVHWLFQPLPEWSATVPAGRSPREVILHSIKSYTANACNRILKKNGAFWQDESYDHWIRDDAELDRVAEYIAMNPVRAGLASEASHFQFSFAYRQK